VPYGTLSVPLRYVTTTNLAIESLRRQNLKRFKKAICNETFKGWDIDDVFKFVAELGYDGVEIHPYTLHEPMEEITPEMRKRIRNSAESADVEIVGVHGVLKTTRDFYYINHPDSSIRAKTVEHIRALIRLCGDLGGKIMVLGASKQRNVLPELTYQQVWDYAVETFKNLLDATEEYGVILCLEPLSYRLTNFITKASEAVKMVEEINHPCFKMMIDVRSATDDEMPIPELIRRFAPYIAHFHANDDNGKGPAMGNADYAGISSALKEIDYKGYLSVEVFDFQSDPETIARESLNALKKFFD